MSNTVISVENLYKEYKLGVISHGTLHRDMQSWWARVRGKDDPNSLISSHHNQEAEKGSFLALNDVSFEVKAGDRVGIIGKNGAGKSTLLKILSRITSPTSGEIKIKGRVGSLLEVGTGFHPELTGRENIYLNGAILGMKKWEVTKKLDEIIDFAGIEKHIDTPVKRYSSGMYVRLAFAVAAHLESEILVIDEVLAVGDAAFQKQALGKMDSVSKNEGRTVLFVSHNMGMISQLCRDVIYLENGKVKSTGITSTSIEHYQRDSIPIEKNNYDISVIDKDRYGNGDARFISFEIDKNILFTGDDLTIKTGIKSKQKVSGATLDIVFYNDKGQRLIDVSSLMKKKQIFMDPEEEKFFLFKIRNILLKPGEYLIGLWLGINNIVDIDGITYIKKIEFQVNPVDDVVRNRHIAPFQCDFTMRELN